MFQSYNLKPKSYNLLLNDLIHHLNQSSLGWDRLGDLGTAKVKGIARGIFQASGIDLVRSEFTGKNVLFQQACKLIFIFRLEQALQGLLGNGLEGIVAGSQQGERPFGQKIAQASTGTFQQSG